MYAIEVRHDTLHRKWHRLSVRIKEPLSSVAALYAMQYAADHQMNPHLIAYSLVNVETGARIDHASDATMNRG